jgi:membrane protein DedA with SNARE-associated domain
MQAHFQDLISYFSAHPGLALTAVFAAATLEAVAVIGTVIPGSTLVFIGGALIGLGVLDPWLTTAVAISGAIVGDGVSFWLGHRYGQVILSKWPLSKHPELFERGRSYFEKRGISSIFMGRFLGPLRAIVPLVAGMSGMPVVQFYVVNVVSAVAWAAAHLLPGVAFGASIQLAGAVSTRLVVLLIAAVGLLWLLLRLWTLVKQHGWPHLAALRDKVVARARERTGLLSTVTLSLLDPSRPASIPLLTAAVFLIGGAWLFGGVVEDVLRRDPLVQFDRTVLNLLQGVRSGWADNIMVTAHAYSGQELATQAKVTIEQAREIALKAHPGKITDQELEREGSGPGLRYSFDILSGKVTREVGVDAMTGKLLEN